MQTAGNSESPYLGMSMGGLSFIHWGFLAGGLAVARLPIAIHLWFRPRPKPVEMSASLWFLKVVLREHSRRRNLRRHGCC